MFQTQPDHFLRVLEPGTVATTVFLWRLHNFALDVGWLPWPMLPKRQWPKRVVGYPERFSPEALGHNRKAVHRAYARQAKVVLPSLESFEEKPHATTILSFPRPEE